MNIKIDFYAFGYKMFRQRVKVENVQYWLLINIYMKINVFIGFIRIK